MYLDLLKNVLVDYHRIEFGEWVPLRKTFPGWKSKVLHQIDKILKKRNYYICYKDYYKPELRIEGLDWPTTAETMIGLKRLGNIEFCFREVIKNNIQGDFIETGVWRGGATIFMRALLKSENIEDRIVWVADSFEGLPKPDADKYKADAGDKHFKKEELAISLETVKQNFEKYGLLDDKVKFLKGWFKDTLPKAPIKQLAILRLDGDMYESTMDSLTSLYSKLSIGGYIIIDDWGAVEGCKLAVQDYRRQNNITEEIIPIDWAGVYWKKEK